MKERPILFSAPMVRAILAGKKTQTRRIVKPQPPAYIDELHGNDLRMRAPYRLEHDETGAVLGSGFQDDNDNLYKCPYGIPGDRLWVRECWRFGYPVHSDGPSLNVKTLQYRADYGDDANFVPWRPSIHMKRQDSRITLEVVAVRVERLQEIGNNDAIAEGCDGERWLDPDGSEGRGVEPWEQFRELWESINGPESWSANPWVWVVEFKRLEQAQ